MENLSDYELEELGDLLSDLRNRINDYRHISEAVPQELNNILETSFDAVIDEERKRAEKE